VSVTSAPLVRRRRLLSEKFPVTILFGLQYGALVVFPAIIHDTPPLGLIISICLVGTGTAFFFEAIRSPLGTSNASPISISPKAAMWILGVGWLAAIGSSITRGVAYVNQTTSASPSHLAAIFTPLTSWLLIGTVLVMTQAAQGQVSRKRAWWVIVAGFALELALSLRAAILSNVVIYFIVITFLAIVLGFIRWRWVIIALFTIPVVLPPLYNLKTQERSSLSKVAEPGQHLNYGQRLRLDREMAQVEDFPTIPAKDINPPSLQTLLLFGLVPRVFDQSRQTLHTGENLSVAVGGSPTSSDTATALGNAYIVDGWRGVFLYSAISALVTGTVIRRRGPWAFALLALITSSCLLVEESYPDMLAGLLQACVSWAAALVAVKLFTRRKAADTRQEGWIGAPDTGLTPHAADGRNHRDTKISSGPAGQLGTQCARSV
jgi:hypothetical protein